MRILLLALLGAWSVPGSAAEPLSRTGPTADARHMSERNHLGLLEFCQRLGHIGPEAVALQRRLVASFPPAAGEDAEAAGRQAIIEFDGHKALFPLSIAAQGVTLRVGCQQIALRVLRQEADR